MTREYTKPLTGNHLVRGPLYQSRLGESNPWCGLLQRNEKVYARNQCESSVRRVPAPTWWIWAGVRHVAIHWVVNSEAGRQRRWGGHEDLDFYPDDLRNT
jgi:hypothetical protein